MLKTTFKKEESKQFIYHDYKNFDNKNFQMDLKVNPETLKKYLKMPQILMHQENEIFVWKSET